MSKANRVRSSYRNRLGLTVLSVITLGCLLGAMQLVNIVVAKNRLAALAAEQRKIEQAIDLYQQEIKALERRIDTSLTRDKIHDRLVSHGTYLQPIEPRKIIILHPVNSSSPDLTQLVTAAPD